MVVNLVGEKKRECVMVIEKKRDVRELPKRPTDPPRPMGLSLLAW